jgi:hypothetical protein
VIPSNYSDYINADSASNVVCAVIRDYQLKLANAILLLESYCVSILVF